MLSSGPRARLDATDAHLPLQAFVRKPEALPDFFAELRSAWAEVKRAGSPSP